MYGEGGGGTGCMKNGLGVGAICTGGRNGCGAGWNG
jgi:hypothetical protein